MRKVQKGSGIFSRKRHARNQQKESSRFPSFNVVAVPLSLILRDYLLIAEAFLEFCQTSMMELFCENSYRIKAVHFFHKRYPS